jgi:hypothetical protein
MANVSIPPSSNHPWRMLFFAGLGLTLLALTNPSQQDYSRFVAWKLKETNCGQSSTLFEVSNVICPLPNNLAAQLISQYTYRDNYVFFSVYRTILLNKEVRSIGIARFFF